MNCENNTQEIQKRSIARLQIAVIGGSNAGRSDLIMAEEIGVLLAKNHVTLLSGGKNGVMEASCKGAINAGGITVGILPDAAGNNYLSVIIKTNMNQARNIILIESADAVIAIGGEYGTLSEIAYALKSEKPVFGLNSWDIQGIIRCSLPEEAVKKALNIYR